MPRKKRIGLYADFIDNRWLCADRITETGYPNSFDLHVTLILKVLE